MTDEISKRLREILNNQTILAQHFDNHLKLMQRNMDSYKRDLRNEFRSKLQAMQKRMENLESKPPNNQTPPEDASKG